MTSRSQEHRRAEIFKANSTKMRARIFALERELKSARTAGYIDGSAQMMAGVVAALNSDELEAWLGQRLMSCRTRRPPFKLSQASDAMVRREIQVLLEKCGQKFDVSRIEL
jgi:hypothetical protein